MDFLFNLLIFSLPFGVILRIGVVPNVYLYPQDIFAGLIFILLAAHLILKRKLIEKKIFILALVFVSFGFISLVINSPYLRIEEFATAFAYLARYASYVSIIFAVSMLKQHERSLIPKKLMIAGALFVFFGFIQYFYYPNLRNLYYLGWDEHLGRLFSTILDPNFAGAFLVLILILTVRDFGKSKMLTVFSIVTLIAIFLTHSRSALIMLAVAGLIFLVANKLYKHFIFFIAVLILGLVIFSNTNFEGLNPLRIASAEARVKSAAQALEIFRNNPIFGVGFNAYRYARIRYGFADREKTKLSNSDAGTDNSFLFVLATTGVIGFLFFLKFWINILRRVYQDKIVFASVMGILTDSLFINSLFLTTIMAWIFILVGVTLSKRL